MPRALFERLLVGLDLDGRSDHALTAALAIAQRFGSQLELVHASPQTPLVWSDAVSLPAGAFVGTEVLEHLRARIEARVRPSIEATPLAHPARLHVVAGHPAHALLARAVELDAGVVFLGAHKRRGLFDFGSTARAVLARAPGGVWLQVEAPRPIERVVCGVDLSEHSLRALACARELAREWRVPLVAVNVFQPPELAASTSDQIPLFPIGEMENVRAEQERAFHAALDRFAEGGERPLAEFKDGDPAQVLLAEQQLGDLCVVGTHGRTGLSAALIGSVAYAVLRGAHGPVLALRHPERSFLLPA